MLQFPLHGGLQKLIADLNHLYKNHSSWSLSDHKGDKFHWIDCDDASGQTLSFIKYGEEPGDTLLIACNFSDQLRHRDWGCPHSGEWKVILDTDSPDYGGVGHQDLLISNHFRRPEMDNPMDCLFRWPMECEDIKIF